MGAGKVASVPHVHLHGGQLLLRFQFVDTAHLTHNVRNIVAFLFLLQIRKRHRSLIPDKSFRIDLHGQFIVQAVVNIPVSIHLEISAKTRFSKNFRHVSADAYGAFPQEAYFFVEIHIAFVFLHGSQVSGTLSVVLLPVFQRGTFKGPDRARIELSIAHQTSHIEIVGLYRVLFYDVVLLESALFHQSTEVFQMAPPMHSPRITGSSCTSFGTLRSENTSEKYISPPCFRMR